MADEEGTYRNTVTVEHNTVTVTITEREASVDEVYTACHKAMLGLGFALEPVNKAFSGVVKEVV
jgi:hypothetical protein